MPEVFICYCLSFPILAIFSWKRVVKVGPKVQTWVRLFSMKAWIPQIFFNQVFCLLEYYLWWEFRQYWTIFGRANAQKPPKKGYFMDAESVRKTLKTFKLITTNAILIRRTTIIIPKLEPKLLSWINLLGLCNFTRPFI